jgi:hypothetical protein
MNNDGRVDLISIRHNKGDISIHYNNGNGTFTETVISLERRYANFLAVSDMNGDKQLDILITFSLVHGIIIFYKIDDNKFIEESVYETKEPHFLQVNDIDNNQRSYIIVTHKKGNISILINDENITFAHQLIYVNLNYLDFLLAADMYNDNYVDIVIGNRQSNFQIAFNTGNVTFYHPVQYPVLMAYHFISIGDVNNDGINDIILIHHEFSEISILVNMKNNQFINQKIFLMKASSKHLATVDINGDRKMEMIAISTTFDEQWIAILTMIC